MKIEHQLPVKKCDDRAILPVRAHPEDAGLDLFALEDGEIKPQQGVMARTGIAVALPQQTVGMIADRSSMAKKGFKTAGGIIDSNYRGEIQIILKNISHETLYFKAGEKIAQLLILPILTPAVLEVDALNETDRGDKGFGSTGQ